MLRKLNYLTKTVKISLIFVSDSLCLRSQGRSCQLVQLHRKEDQEVKMIATSHSLQLQPKCCQATSLTHTSHSETKLTQALLYYCLDFYSGF